MYLRSVSCVLLLLLAVGASGQQATSQLEADLRKHVEYLASDELAGRKTGEPGATTAAGYITNQFAQAKLRPGFKAASGSTTYLQPFPYVSGIEYGTDNFLRIIPAKGAGESKMEAGVNFQPFGNSINGYVPPAALVFAGYGIVTQDKSRDDYSGLDVKGKIVLVHDGTPDAGDPHSALTSFNIHTKANLAKERGARALILIARDADFSADPLARLAYEPSMGETAIPVVSIGRAEAAKLFSLGINEKAPLPTISATAQVKVDLKKKTVEAYNVIGILEGTDPVLKNEAIVIGAHYDHLGRGGRSSLSPNSSDIHHGADDNASGTAAVIELARMFASTARNQRTIIFMAFGAEEEGLIGSKYYVNNPVWPLDKTVAMINLDMVGRMVHDNPTPAQVEAATTAALASTVSGKSTPAQRESAKLTAIYSLVAGKLTVGGIGTATEWKTVVEKANSTLGLDLTGSDAGQPGYRSYPIFNLQLNQDGFGPSDHSSFYGKQIPVLFFFTGTHLDYHKPTDTADKVNYDGLTKITNYVASIARTIDANPQRPTYKVAQSSGTMAVRTAFSVSLGTIPSYAESNDGLGIDGVRDGSPAAKAGLKGGDKIIKLAGKDVRNISDYMFAMSTMKAGDEYEVVVKRGAETLALKIVPAPAARR